MAEHFNARSQINKYKLDESTFDLVDVDGFHNTKASTIFAYLLTWILILLSWVLLGADIYTCLNILVFHRWSTSDYKPYAYSIAKWIFTGCIIFEFCLLLYHWIWAIYTYKTKNIALAYVNNIARLLYSVRSYNYFCLFNQIQQDNFFDWSCFFCYGELDNALQVLVADTPRQVINILTLRYYATDGESNNNILENIKTIATTNLTLSIILSLMCVSVVIWSIFFIKFSLGMILYLPVAFKVKSITSNSSLKKYCCDLVNKNVRLLVLKHHKSKRELLDKGILDKHDIITNPLLNNSSTDLENLFVPPPSQSSSSLIKPPPVTTSIYELKNLRKDSTTGDGDPFNDSSSTIFDQQRKRPPPISKSSHLNTSQSSLTTLNQNQNPNQNYNVNNTTAQTRKYPQPLDVTTLSSRYNPPRNTSLPMNQSMPYQQQKHHQQSQPRKPSNDSTFNFNTKAPPNQLHHSQTDPNLFSKPYESSIPYHSLQTSHTLQSLDSSYQAQTEAQPTNPFIAASQSYHSNEFQFNHASSSSPPQDSISLNHKKDDIVVHEDDLSDSSSHDTPYPLREIDDEHNDPDGGGEVPYPSRGVSIYDYYNYNYDQIKSQYEK